MGRARPRKKEASLFTQFEIEQMKKLSQEAKEQPLNQNFYEKLTKRFNLASGRAGKTPLRWDQVQSWFQRKKQDYPIELSSSPSMQKEKEVVVLSDDNVSNSAHENSSAPESCSDIRKGEVPDLSRFEFEARSSKDEAWYDVASFLTHRVLRSGELEVRVRFVGFGAEEDEWVKVKKAVRERSLPLEPSECQKVAVGDLVLCFRETSDHATYHDAHIVDIQKRLHDIRGCRCLFLVRYDHDHMEERVPLRKICRRPTH